jgi:hypothetical protein
MMFKSWWGQQCCTEKKNTKNPKTLFLGWEGVNYSQIFVKGLKT